MKKLQFFLFSLCVLLFMAAHQVMAQPPFPTFLTVKVVNTNNLPIPNKTVVYSAQTMGTIISNSGETNSNGMLTFEITVLGTANVLIWTEDCTGDTLSANIVLNQNQSQTVTLTYCANASNCVPIMSSPATAYVNTPVLFEFANMPVVFNCLVSGGPGPFTISWSIDNQAITGADSNFYQHTFTSPGTYTVCLNVNAPTIAPGYTVCKNITILADSGDCELFTDFTFNINNTTATFYAQGDTINNSFTWEVNNVALSSGTFLIYDFQSPGQYVVCLTEYKDSLCFKTVCKTITIQGGQQGLNIFGSVYADGNCPPDNVSLQLIGIFNNAYYESMQAGGIVDSCMYFFGNNIPGAAYLLRAIPSGVTATAYLPTYYGNTADWLSSTFVPTIALPVLPYNIDLVPFGFDSTYIDSGFVNGYIAGVGGTVYTIMNGDTIYTTFQTGNTIIIIYNSQGQPVAFTTMNSDGTFSFPSLPYGNYTLQVQHPLVNHTPLAFSISATEPGRWIQGQVNNDGVGTIVSLQNAAQRQNMLVYPNPAQDRVHIRGAAAIQSVQLIEVSGRKINAAFDGASLKVEHLRPGIYWLKVLDSTGNISTHKLIKQ